MARPQKTGIDYFPLDVNMDDKVKLIDAKFGVTGFGILVKLWQIIYDNGYYIKWTEKELLLYKTRINADINLINDVINECLKWGIFSSELYNSYSILTSSGIQKRYFEAAKRRTEITLVNEFILVPLPENYKPIIKAIPAKIITSEVIVNRNLDNANNNSKNADSSTQSKVKKSKVIIEEEDARTREGKIFQFFNQNIGLITPFQAQVISQYLDSGIEAEMIVEVLQDSLGKSDRWSWANTVLKNSLSQNVKTLEQYEAKKVERKNSRSRDKPVANMRNFTERKFNETEFDKFYEDV